MRRLMLYKRVFGAVLGGGTLLVVFWLKKRKGHRLKLLLEDCTRIHVDEGIYDPKVALYRFVMV